MGFASLMLADSARVADGLLFVLGGGVNQFHRPIYPAPLQVVLVGLIELPVGYSGELITFTVEVKAAEDEDVYAHFEAGFQVGLKPGAMKRGNTAPIVIDLAPVALPKPGFFVVEATIADEEPSRAYFTVSRDAASESGQPT
ncbi:hypothetical protein AAFP30_22370 [Gordonia sp. CPCC 205515]|uniref:DUF6941 family protein n=1 Tax=Gordonia sp. CPCC 205515 TaxID=3140791 RepID=UPI003AF3D1FA